VKALLFAITLSVFSVAGCEPRGPFPGGPLEGELVSGPTEDWSFAGDRYGIEVETRAGRWLRSARAWFVVQDGALYLYTASPVEFGWIRRLREEDVHVRLRIGGKLYATRAILLTDPAEIEPLLPEVLAKYYGVEASRVRWVGSSPRFPGTQLQQWFFRVEPASGDVAPEGQAEER
jgi:hypothetical protein